MHINVSSVMLSKLVTCDAESTLSKVSQKIIDEDAGSVLIKQEEEIVGIITEKDLVHTHLLQQPDFFQNLLYGF